VSDRKIRVGGNENKYLYELNGGPRSMFCCPFYTSNNLLTDRMGHKKNKI
jgi:hypothetical protein